MHLVELFPLFAFLVNLLPKYINFLLGLCMFECLALLLAIFNEVGNLGVGEVVVDSLCWLWLGKLVTM